MLVLSLPSRTCTMYLYYGETGRKTSGVVSISSVDEAATADLLELLDRLTPAIAKMTQAIEQEMGKCPEAQRLQTHPGVGSPTALAFVQSSGGQ